MNIRLNDKNGATLNTAEKYCPEDIILTLNLQSKSVTENGSVVADDGYCGLSSVEVNVAQTPTQTKTVDLAMADGDQTIPPDSGKTLSSVTVIKPSTMLPANIKKGVNIGGVVGTLEGGIDIADTTATAADVRVGKDFYAADGTKTQGTIADYDGSFTGAGSRSNLNVHYGDTAPTDTSKLWIKSTEPESIEFIQDPEQQVQGLTTLSATLPTAAGDIAAAAVGTKIYLFGGYGDGVFLNTIQEFDIETKTLTTLDVTLPNKVSQIAAAAVGTKIYLFGGYLYWSSGAVLNTIQVFDTETKTLTTLDVTLPYKTYAMGVAAVGTKIYLFGGYAYDSNNDSLQLSDIREFNTINNTIRTLATSVPSSSEIAAAAVGTKIYLFGGNGYSSGVIREFDTETTVLTTLDVTLPQKSSKMGIAAIGTKIYLFGGYIYSSPYNQNTIQVFDTETKTLTTLDVTLPASTSTLSAVATVGTKIYLFGGISNYIQEFVAAFGLTSGNILGQQDYNKNIFTLVPSPTKVTIGLKNVYKGNSSNIAEFVDAYLYNGTNWVNVNTGETA